MVELSRRSFLQASAGSLMATGTARSQGAATDVVVVGAGAFGGWTALHLREMGHAVTLVDAYGPGNARASSGGETRQIRAGYGDREVYSRWVLRALESWKRREAEWGTRLLFETGRLQLAPAWNEELRSTRAVFDKLGIAYEVLTHDDVRRRYPQMSAEGVELAVLEPGAGVLRARFAMQVVCDDFQKKGGRFVVGRAVPPSTAGSGLDALPLEDGTRLSASAYVLACGPWLPKVLPDVLGGKIFSPRRDVFFFGPPPGDDRFDYGRFPNYEEEGYYGFPNIDGRGFKVCPVGEMTPFDPDRDERVASPYQLQRARAYLRHRFPALAEQPLVESRVCQLEMSVDEHLIVQKHPRWSNVWIAGGGSGHAFKLGPTLGAYVAKRITGADEEPELEPLFRIKPETFDADHTSGARRYDDGA
jgi:glycine/D-amino acid oxidase-like deaminating enzyme